MSEKSIPLQVDELDGWLRTADGRLVQPGNEVWTKLDGDEWQFLIVLAIDLRGRYLVRWGESWRPLSECYAVKPEQPVTVESALRNIVESIEGGAIPTADNPMIEDARKALEQSAKG